MANYAEQLAYWYLRLNGFFPLENYVYHRISGEGSRTFNADADLLAIRPPHYYEEIPHLERNTRGHEDILRVPLVSDDWMRELDGRWVGVIVEVKGSEQVGVEEIRNAFTPSRLIVAIQRMGLITDIDSAVDTLSQQSRYEAQTVAIIKLAFSQTVFSESWETITLSQADSFIVHRMTSAQNYLAKSGSRYFFPSELI